MCERWHKLQVTYWHEMSWKWYRSSNAHLNQAWYMWNFFTGLKTRFYLCSPRWEQHGFSNTKGQDFVWKTSFCYNIYKTSSWYTFIFVWLLKKHLDPFYTQNHLYLSEPMCKDPKSFFWTCEENSYVTLFPTICGWSKRPKKIMSSDHL